MEAEIELKFVDGRVYLNYWDWGRGRDLICEIKDGELFKFVHDPLENEELELQQAEYDPFKQKKITLQEFVDYVKNRERNNNAEFHKE